MDWNFLIKPDGIPCEQLRISTDTRNLKAGCTYFALHGENFDGNQFAAQALQLGAERVIVDDKTVFSTLPSDRAVLVSNTLLALQNLALTWRRFLNTPILAITGTNGKTTTKELVACVLSTKYNTLFTAANLNNHVGVPLTLLQLTKKHQYAIIEMGASHPTDIETLAAIAEPDYGLITNVGMAHLEGFGTFENVKKTKAELYDFIYEHNGILFRNLDNPFLAEMDAMVRAKFPQSKTQTIGYKTGIMPQETQLIGAYNAENISAARCVGRFFGIDEADIGQAIATYKPDNWRSQEEFTDKNHLVIDAYNANLTSMQAAIECFKGNAFILGEMRELGEYSQIAHQNIVNMLLEQKKEKVFLIGQEWKKTTAPYPIFATTSDFIEYLQSHPLQNQYILVKGSRKNHLETLVSAL